jgi:hypothetical protein
MEILDFLGRYHASLCAIVFMTQFRRHKLERRAIMYLGLGYLSPDSLRIVCTRLACAPHILSGAKRLSPLDIVSR